MACSRGKASPDKHTTLRLFAASGGYCQRPGCGTPLFQSTASKDFHIGEMAHIIAAGDGGPRADEAITKEEKGAFVNLILLCPNCHTAIDKAPVDFPSETIVDWKNTTAIRLAEIFGAVQYDSRELARTAIFPLLRENRAVFDRHGPHNEYAADPESEFSLLWHRLVLSSLVPRNRQILMIANANRAHMTDEEFGVIGEFRAHVDALEARHLGAYEGGGVPQFPEAMDKFFGVIS